MPGYNSFSFKLVFQELEENVTDINITEAGSSGSWDFYGIKLMDEQTLAAWKTKKAEEDQQKQAAIAMQEEGKRNKAEQVKLEQQKRTDEQRLQKSQQVVLHE